METEFFFYLLCFNAVSKSVKQKQIKKKFRETKTHKVGQLLSDFDSVIFSTYLYGENAMRELNVLQPVKLTCY